MNDLKQNPTLRDFQEHIAAFCKEWGWETNTYMEEFFLMTEEIGELAKAMRKASNFQTEEAKNKGEMTRFELEEEFADVFNYLLNLANLFDVDMEKAYRAKFEYNKSRKWSQ
jgi:NTP pyrophosphatase (non-canonical NTP hydrolase)